MDLRPPTRGGLVALALLIAASVGAQSDAPTAQSPPAPPWKLVWSDEFDTPGRPDPKRWSYETGRVRNRELQFYTEGRMENGRVENGHLIVEARHEPWPAPSQANAPSPSPAPGNPAAQSARNAPAEFTSASVTTLGRAAWTYGRIDVRAKLPAARGTWPAIWMLGTNMTHVGWPACGEIDIMEFVGYEPGVVHANIHTKAYNHVLGTGKGAKAELPDASSGFHVYSLEWTAAALDFFVDGRRTFTYANDGTGPDAWPFNKGQYLILNLAIGGTWGGRNGVDAEAFPQRMEVDYVRVYQREPGR